VSVKDSLERIEKEVHKLPKEGRSIFLCWEAARAGIPLDTEASFDALRSRIEALESATAGRFLSELEKDLEIVCKVRA
jgi:hypothetical protein